MRKKIQCCFCVLTICFLFSFPLNNAKAEGNEIDISTSPHKVFFEITNSKPGDTYTKVLTVSNNGSQKLNYLLSSRFLTGSEEFYNELLFKITNTTEVLYSGKLKDFNKLNPRSLKRKESEKLNLSISIPSELGNNYQGLDTEFQFKFYVEGTLGGLLPADGPKLPSTGSNMFNILAFGFMFTLVGLFISFKGKIKKQI
jgi:LPXTG-motif cell wall-anchored protein